MAAYSTCPHLSLRQVLDALDVLESTPSSWSSSWPSYRQEGEGELRCIFCERVGNLRDPDFLYHCEREQHHVCVHVRQRELYCMSCGDFQYCSFWDSANVGKDVQGHRQIQKRGGRTLLTSEVPALLSAPSTSEAPFHTTGGAKMTTKTGTESQDAHCGSSSVDSSVTAAKRVKSNKRKVTLAQETSQHTRGMCNMGSTCFMNSVLQLIVQNPLLRKFNDTMARDSLFRATCCKPPHGLRLLPSNKPGGGKEDKISSSSSSLSKFCICFIIGKMN